MPNRVLKESIKRSPQIDALTWFEEVVYYRLMVTADDYGCLDGRIVLLKNDLFPTKDSVTKKAVEDAISKLVSVGLLCQYTANDMPYLFFPTWEKHQRLRNKHRKYPNPADFGVSVECQSNDSQMTARCQAEIEIESEKEKEKKSKGAERADRTPLEIALDEFAKHRKAMKKPLTDKARELTLNELEKLAPGDDDMKIAILNQSIQRGWQGVFELKEDAPHSAPAPKGPAKNVSWRDGPDYLPDWSKVDK